MFLFKKKSNDNINDSSDLSDLDEVNDDYDDDDSEALDVDDAAQIWRSYGRDEDYMFGFTQEELENALD